MAQKLFSNFNIKKTTFIPNGFSIFVKLTLDVP